MIRRGTLENLRADLTSRGRSQASGASVTDAGMKAAYPRISFLIGSKSAKNYLKAHAAVRAGIEEGFTDLGAKGYYRRGHNSVEGPPFQISRDLSQPSLPLHQQITPDDLRKLIEKNYAAILHGLHELVQAMWN